MTLHPAKLRKSKISITATIKFKDIKNPNLFPYHKWWEKLALIGTHTTCPSGWCRITGMIRATVISRLEKDELSVAKGHEPRSTREIVGLDDLTKRPKLDIEKEPKVNVKQSVANAWLQGRM
jgi:hypothetical protein